MPEFIPPHANLSDKFHEIALCWRGGEQRWRTLGNIAAVRRRRSVVDVDNLDQLTRPYLGPRDQRERDAASRKL